MANSNGSQMDELTYPENLSQQNFWNCNLGQYGKRLTIESRRLFGDVGEVDFLQLADDTAYFTEFQVATGDEMKQKLSEWTKPKEFSRCQYVFIHAKSSRQKLKITKPMLQTLLSQHNTMPNYLDFIFPFGKQTANFKKNLHFSGFRTREMFEGYSQVKPTSSTAIPTNRFQMCYNLRSVESTPNPPEWPWSVRQTAVFHSFDLNLGDASWITVKGNRDMFDRFRRITQPSAPSDPSLFITPVGAFKASLAAHLLLCEWSGENWAEYVGFLEDRLQDKTRGALLATVDLPRRPKTGIRTLGHVDTFFTPQQKVPRRSTLQEVSSKLKTLVSSTKPTPDPRDIEKGQPEEKNDEEEDEEDEYVDFSYEHLRAIQRVEDDTNVTLLHIKSNVNILTDLNRYYNEMEKCAEFQTSFKSDCASAMARFTAQVKAVISDLKLQQARLETLLRMVADRKSLLFQLFEHRNMSANKRFTEKAQDSAQNMEKLTNEMRGIALKTEEETIFMRIVTLVTLFFLPGTFVATLMSTDIIRFQNNGDLMHTFSWQALIAYLGITLPIMAFTLWVAFKYFEGEKRKHLQHETDTKETHQAEGEKRKHLQHETDVKKTHQVEGEKRKHLQHETDAKETHQVEVVIGST